MGGRPRTGVRSLKRSDRRIDCWLRQRAGKCRVQTGWPFADRLLRQHAAQRRVVVGEPRAKRFRVELFALVFADEKLGEGQVENDGLVAREIRILGDGFRRVGRRAIEPVLDDLGGPALGRDACWFHVLGAQLKRESEGKHRRRGAREYSRLRESRIAS